MSGDHNQNQTDSGWRKRQIALDIKAENARELGLDYEPSKTVIEMATEAGLFAGPVFRDGLERLSQPEQEPVAHLWECIGRWSAYLVNNGKQADCAPPSWLIDAVNNATTPPVRTWVDLTPQDLNDIFKISHTGEGAVYLALKIIKEKNA